MRIAVVSDTHDLVPADLLERIGSADEIWHLGDVCADGALAEFEALGPPVRVVLGNCDEGRRRPLSLDFDYGGTRLHLVHIPPDLAPPGVHVVLHGHTHQPRDWTDPLGVRWLNPGSASKPRGGHPPSFAWLEVDERGLRRWDIQPLARR